jgi:hypothetical protein
MRSWGAGGKNPTLPWSGKSCRKVGRTEWRGAAFGACSFSPSSSVSGSLRLISSSWRSGRIRVAASAPTRSVVRRAGRTRRARHVLRAHRIDLVAPRAFGMLRRGGRVIRDASCARSARSGTHADVSHVLHLTQRASRTSRTPKAARREFVSRDELGRSAWHLVKKWVQLFNCFVRRRGAPRSRSARSDLPSPSPRTRTHRAGSSPFPERGAP